MRHFKKVFEFAVIFLGICQAAAVERRQATTCAAVYNQCGGSSYKGVKTCCSGSECLYRTQWYSQCVPITSSSKSPSPSPTKTTSTTVLRTTTSMRSPSPVATLPSKFSWTTTGTLMEAKPDASHPIAALKDPSVVYYEGKYHLFVSTTDTSGNYNMAYLSFDDWPQAPAAKQYFLDTTAIGGGYKTAPHIFYHTPSKLWYLFFQTGDNAGYSTNTDISNPSGWTATKFIYSGMPTIVRENIGDGYWLDFWVICDTSLCHLFSSDDNGHLYRSETSLTNFPNGFTQPVIALQDANRYDLFEASNVYKVKGTNQYLLIVEAIGANGRYFRSWTSTSIAGPFTPLAATESNPFAGYNNVVFNGPVWTKSISSGGLITDSYDETQEISACGMRFLYQGLSPDASGEYNLLPWKIAMLTQNGC